MGLMAIVEVEEIDPPSRIGSEDKADPSAQVELSDDASTCSDADSWNEPAFYYDEIEWKHEEAAYSYGADIRDEAKTIVSTGDGTDFKDRVATDIIAQAVYEKGDSDMVNCGSSWDQEKLEPEMMKLNKREDLASFSPLKLYSIPMKRRERYESSRRGSMMLLGWRSTKQCDAKSKQLLR
ncbi:uncharacterized protein J4E92_010398 [Alternaria infectoria]|uniref:uncharacterized protein n=1 Tax=Alternaria infectoria TaxID=45303 RepID=UPI002220787C|nr:uncharacterized protein J4E92_010398 [Alternaria infectoria]KAI4910639.1 hypothetical protein J4E92_010398 [Alternaria infectoria]